MIAYLSALQHVLDNLNHAQINKVVKLLEGSKNVYVVGNGGSHSTAEHFATDLIKFGNKKAYTLSNLAQLTMAANDYTYEHSFSWLLRKYCQQDDVVIGITTSGASANVLRSVFFDVRVKTVFITGANGHYMAKKADSAIIIPTTNTQLIEDVSLILCHIITKQLEERKKKCQK